jgi:hypothetical protein
MAVIQLRSGRKTRRQRRHTSLADQYRRCYRGPDLPDCLRAGVCLGAFVEFGIFGGCLGRVVGDCAFYLSTQREEEGQGLGGGKGSCAGGVE